MTGPDDAKGFGTSMLRGLLVDVGLPIITYYVLHAAGADDWVALLAATGVALLRLLYSVVRERRVNQFAIVMLAVYGIGLAATLITGDPRVLLLKNSLVTGALGLVFLGSALHGKRPLTLSAMQSISPARAAVLEQQFVVDPDVRRGVLTTCYVWGAGLLAEAIIRIPVVYALPIDVAYGVSEGMFIATMVLLVGFTVWSIRRGERAG